MGIGFVVIVDAGEEAAALEAIHGAGYGAKPIGTVDDGAGMVRLEPLALVGALEDGESVFKTE
jgi:phosphoribosylaminoimidazole (AIR) synthetase